MQRPREPRTASVLGQRPPGLSASQRQLLAPFLFPEHSGSRRGCPLVGPSPEPQMLSPPGCHSPRCLSEAGGSDCEGPIRTLGRTGLLAGRLLAGWLPTGWLRPSGELTAEAGWAAEARSSVSPTERCWRRPRDLGAPVPTPQKEKSHAERGSMQASRPTPNVNSFAIFFFF